MTISIVKITGEHVCGFAYSDLSVKRKIDKHREKILRVDSILQKNSFVQPVPSSNQKNSFKKRKMIQRSDDSSQVCPSGKSLGFGFFLMIVLEYFV